MIIDSHTHIRGPDKGDGAAQSPEEIIERMDRAGVDRAVVFPFNDVDKGPTFSNSNSRVIEYVQKYPDRLTGFCRLDPKFGKNAVEELWRCINLGLKGVKLHPASQRFAPDSPAVLDIIRKAADLGVPVVFDNGKDISPNKEIGKLADAVPGAAIILAHMRGGDFIDVAKRHDNIHLGTVKADIEDVKEAIKVLGPERIIAGSDSPYADMKDEIITKFDQIEWLKEREKSLIRGKNIERLID